MPAPIRERSTGSLKNQPCSHHTLLTVSIMCQWPNLCSSGVDS